MTDYNFVSTWYLDNLDGSMDIQEDETGVTKVREHIVISIHQQIDVTAMPSNLDLGETASSITYNCGNASETVNPAGSGKFICVADGGVPVGHPSEFMVRRQTWEYYGPWEDAPEEWNQ